MPDIDASMQGVHWVRTSKERFEAPTSAASADHDLVVIGAGYAGLSIARHAADLGQSVLLLEAGRVGCGASGRNGGIVVPHFPGGVAVEDVEALHGRARSDRLADLVAGGAAWLFDEIRRLGIACDAEQNGWFQPAHSDRAMKKVERVYRGWASRGADVEWLDAAAIRERTGAPGYLGGWFGRTGGTLNPFALAQGLARVCLAQGVCILEDTAVQGLRADGPAQIVKTSRGEFRARKVVIATNGYTPALAPGLGQSVIPVRLYQTLTRPLTEEEMRGVLPRRQCFTDLRKSGGFARYDSENRLMSGGAVFVGAEPRRYGVRHSERRIADLFPHLAGIEITDYWQGFCALTESALPAIERLDRNVFALIGFSTRGVVLSQTLGREIAQVLAETKPEADLPLPIGPVKRIPLQAIKTFLGGYAFPIYQARDRLGLS